MAAWRRRHLGHHDRARAGGRGRRLSLTHAAGGPAPLRPEVPPPRPPPLRRSMRASTSERVMRPPAPVPSICRGSRWCSAIKRRTTGESTNPPSPPSAPLGAAAGPAGRSAASDVGGAPDCGLGGRLRRAPDSVSSSASVGWLGRRAWTGRQSARGLDLGAASASARARPRPTRILRRRAVRAGPRPPVVSGSDFAAGPPVASAPSEMTANRVPTSTVSPSATRISVRTPPTGEGTSESTLSVDTSKSTSSSATGSPTCFIQRVMVPSVTVSPNWGIVISANVQASSRQGEHRLAEGLRQRGVRLDVVRHLLRGRLPVDRQVGLPELLGHPRADHVHPENSPRLGHPGPSRRSP